MGLTTSQPPEIAPRSTKMPQLGLDVIQIFHSIMIGYMQKKFSC